MFWRRARHCFPARRQKPQSVSQSKNGEDPTPPLPEEPRRARFAISSLKDAALHPESAELKRILDFARQRAVHYTETLPNFTCIEVTRRSADPTGQENWRLKDSITELLRYQEKTDLHTSPRRHLASAGSVLITDGIPVKFCLRESEIMVDYDYAAIGNNDYLVPVQAEVRTRQGKRYLIKNHLEFRDYKKYGAAFSITFGEPE